jgi:hypothetical protein
MVPTAAPTAPSVSPGDLPLRVCFTAFGLKICGPPGLNGLGLSNVKILITLPDREGGVWSEEFMFMAEDLGEEDIGPQVQTKKTDRRMASKATRSI